MRPAFLPQLRGAARGTPCYVEALWSNILLTSVSTMSSRQQKGPLSTPGTPALPGGRPGAPPHASKGRMGVGR